MPTELETFQPETPKQGPRRLLGCGLAEAKFARFIDLSRRACQGARLAIGTWSIHGFTPSPGPPPLVKARVASHPLPQGGEG